MKNKIILSTIFSILLLTVFQTREVTAQNPIKVIPNAAILSRGWKHAQFGTQTETLQFINGAKGVAVGEFRVSSVATRGGITFHIFYQTAALSQSAKNWQAKRFNSADEALNFINAQPAKEFRISGATTANQPQSFFLFYRETSGGTPVGWGWKLSENPDDVRNFLNRQGGYTQYVRDADIATIGSNFYIFYKPAVLAAPPSQPFPSWGWVKRETTDSAVDILNKGTTNVEKLMPVARIGAVIEPPYTVFYIFYQ